jgi:hypothetical protein
MAYEDVATSTRVAPLLVDSAATSVTLSTSQPHYVSQENLSNNGDHIFATFDTRVLLLCGIHVYSTQRPIGWINSVVAFRDQAIGWSSHPPGFPPELSEGEPNPLRRFVFAASPMPYLLNMTRRAGSTQPSLPLGNQRR